ncbi:MAG: hypothetical protein IPN51_16265 [Chloracidobacterium sp.]|nr:hypothetical protein [Chloracidobacterium sp.]
MYKYHFGLLIILALSSIIFAGETCTSQKVTDRLNGVWEGDDSYFLKFRTKAGKLCVSVVDEEGNVTRTIKDIVVVKGRLVHLSYYTAMTGAYVVYVNIKVSGDKMKFDWFSSYDLQTGTDTYERRH